VASSIRWLVVSSLSGLGSLSTPDDSDVPSSDVSIRIYAVGVLDLLFGRSLLSIWAISSKVERGKFLTGEWMLFFPYLSCFGNSLLSFMSENRTGDPQLVINDFL